MVPFLQRFRPNLYGILNGKSVGKASLGRPKQTWDIKNKIELKSVVYAFLTAVSTGINDPIFNDTSEILSVEAVKFAVTTNCDCNTQ